jgi:hypothetical protein
VFYSFIVGFVVVAINVVVACITIAPVTKITIYHQNEVSHKKSKHKNEAIKFMLIYANLEIY